MKLYNTEYVHSDDLIPNPNSSCSPAQTEYGPKILKLFTTFHIFVRTFAALLFPLMIFSYSVQILTWMGKRLMLCGLCTTPKLGLTMMITWQC